MRPLLIKGSHLNQKIGDQPRRYREIYAATFWNSASLLLKIPAAKTSGNGPELENVQHARSDFASFLCWALYLLVLESLLIAPVQEIATKISK